MTAKLLFGILSLIPAFFAYAFYIRDTIAGKTKPHTFSWLIWGILAVNACIAQAGANAGAGVWATGFTAAANVIIFVLALFKGDTRPSAFDWLLLILGLTGFGLLFIIDNRTIAVCLTIFATSLGFAITFKKAHTRPGQETAKTFTLNAIKFLPSILALSSFSFLTVAYPLTGLLGNAALAAFIYLRRKSLSIEADSIPAA